MKPIRWFLLAVLPLSGCLSGRPGAPRSTECVRSQEPPAYSYCISRPRNPNGDVLYYLHGAGGNERSWVSRKNYTEALRVLWAAGNEPQPTAVAVSFGPTWLLAQKNNSPESGLFERFTDVVMPEIEAKLPPANGRRVLMGESMGGFNAAQLVLRKPELFKRAALLCPGLSDLSPHNPSAVADYLRRTHADPDSVRRGLALQERFFPDEDSWSKASPMHSGWGLLSGRTPPLYISCGKSDEYGFFEPALAFTRLAQSRGVDARWIPLDGGHCAVDTLSLAAFLSTGAETHP